ncbi:hypothetical protein [Paracidovorax wautersii]|uniref:Uncharacterized protein n=1 Tax=Paracidovorax wautersii TaxID=1177982 RepID=A0A1I2GBI0_9BURK|nr:hypothetical protein [Paracidovorax wautersii]SFF15114.1 hypothetical protein SAMN04489711_11489 [Paracidovorax wautersii]
MVSRIVWSLVFALLYLRNLPSFGGDRVYTRAATRMDVDLLRYRRAQARKARGQP